MNKYIIQFGISGGFNNSDNYKVILAENEEQASNKAWLESCDIYEQYLGYGGLRDIYEIMEDEDCSEEDAIEIFNDERESWIDYMVYEYSEEKVKEIEENYGIEFE